MHHFEIGDFSPGEQTSVSIGIFDGVHLGHQAVLSQCKAASDSAGLKSVCLTFHPHPAEILAPNAAPEYICSLSQRIEFIMSYGHVDHVVVAPFDKEFAQLSPNDFVRDLLVGKLNAAQICVGADFRYGRGRAGGVMDLESAGDQLGFNVNIVHAVSSHAKRVSSTEVRGYIANGDINNARALLGRDFTLRGTVVEGKKLGRTIGFPTLNIKPESPKQILPSDGVYSGYTKIGSTSNWVRSAISVGTNPTTDKDTDRKVEAYLLDGFNQDVYGQTVDIRFVSRLRDQETYSDIQLLIEQIRVDINSIETNLQIQP